MSAGIAAWGTYLPYWRLQRTAIGSVLGSGGGRGTRAVASHDEDTTTLGVEAGRRALGVGPGPGAVQDLFLSTPDPPYLDKTSATTVHAALGLGRESGAYDFAGSSRSAVGTLLQALVAAGDGMGAGRTTLAVVSDLRTGLAGSTEERDSGDGAAAFICAPEDAVVQLIGRGAASDEFLDRWRVPGEADSHVWEERFGEELYVPLAREAFAAALEGCRAGRGRRRPRDRHRAPRAGGQGGDQGAGCRRRASWLLISRAPSGISAPPTQVWRSAMCSSGPSQGR